MPAKVEVQKKEKKDVAKATILVLLILTILLSVISTWYILDTINSVKQQYQSLPSIAYGRVSVGIVPKPGEETGGENTLESVPVTGRITLGIIEE